ncbi:LacI family DNA-binding transcriptional regulator [Microlunatus flavus]|uniref:LacI family DNA-binding transcriptional regulator n=1 Tax=Microlunatus flavus TaxID=1036181 RepID=UPI001E6570BB|nr:LacI family DNA-binding transcriptional regulator [Microlunatus flavus]
MATKGASVVKIVDVAEAAQVSVATVSRALNNNARVDPVLVERVREAAERLGYRPNAVARNLRRQGTRVWALIITDINNPFYTAVARGVEDRAQEAGYSVLLCNTDEDQAKEDRYLQVAAQERVAGVILAPRSTVSDTSILEANGIPLVVVDRQLDREADFITGASFEGAVMATEHLIREGWQRPACITRPSDTDTTEQRRKGYEDVVRRHGLPETVRHVPFHTDGGVSAIRELFDGDDPPDSLLTVDSMLALGALTEVQRRGLRPGRDVGIIGFDDAVWTTVVDPPLSVVAQPAYEIGAEAARLLVRRIRGLGPATPQTLIMSTTLILRGSSRRVRRR